MKLSEMQIYIIALYPKDYKVMKSKFQKHPNVHIVNSDFETFMNEHENVECIVSPANAYGYMDGGYDAAISNYLGWDFQIKVQKYIKNNFYGEQLIGTSFIMNAPKNKKLIHTPTMMVPEVIVDDRIVYHCMRSSLLCALKHNIKSIVLPLFGAGTGEVNIHDVAHLMYEGYRQIIEAEKGIFIIRNNI